MTDSPPEDGYYWYFSHLRDEGDLKSETPQIIELFTFDERKEICVCGGDLTYRLYEAHGKFIGPLPVPKLTE